MTKRITIPTALFVLPIAALVLFGLLQPAFAAKDANNMPVSVRIPVEYRMDGNASLASADTYTLPEGIAYLDGSVTTSGDAATAEVHEGTISVSVPELSSETVIQFKAKVKLMNGTAKNIAIMTGDKIGEVRDEADITVKQPNPTLEKSASKSSAKVGDIVTYTLTVSSDVPMINAKIVDKPSEGVEILSGSERCSVQAKTLSVKRNVLTAEFDSLKDPVTISYDAKITKKGELTNVAALTADNFPKGPLKADTTVTAKVPIGKTTTDNKGTTGTPKTGDAFHLGIVIAMLAATAGIILALFIRRRMDNEDDADTDLE